MESSDWLVLRRFINAFMNPKRFEPSSLSDHGDYADLPVDQNDLVALVSRIIGIPAETGQTNCQDCQNELAAFIDVERQADISQAAREYPHIWWHLLRCVDCAETYRFTTLLLDAEQEGQLPPLDSVLRDVLAQQPVHNHDVSPAAKPPGVRIFHQFVLRRNFLTRIFSISPALGVAYGHQDEEIVLAEEDLADYEIHLSVRKDTDGSWCVVVSVDPPIMGWGVLKIGDQSFRARFDECGEANVSGIPTELLIAPDAPDMAIAIETDA